MSSTPDDLAAAVMAALDRLAGRTVDGTDRLVADLGLDSLGLYELALALDQLVPGFELPPDLDVGDVTALDVVHYLGLVARPG